MSLAPSIAVPRAGFNWLPLTITLFCLLWSFAFVAGKIGVTDCPPLILLTARFSLAGVLILGISALRNEGWQLSWRDVVVFAVLGVANEDPVGTAVLGELDAVDVLRVEPRAEALRLIAELLHHLRAHDPVAVAGVVLHLGRLLEQAAPREALYHERIEVRAGRVERSGVTRGTAADDDDILDVSYLHTHHFTF